MNFADNNILLLLISLVFIYATLSILVSILIDWWDSFYGKRGEHLQQSILQLLNDPGSPGFGQKIYDSVVIKGLTEVEKKLPGFIASNTFADALIETVIQDVTTEAQNGTLPTPQQLAQRFQTGVNQLPDGPLKTLLQSFIDRADGDYDGLKKQIESWFNTVMKGVTSAFKGIQRKKSLVFGFVVAIALNVDSLHLVKVLSLDDNLKQSLVANAEIASDNYEASNKQLDKVVAEMHTEIKPDSNKRTIVYNRAFERNLKLLEEKTANLSDSNKMKIEQLDSALDLVSSLNIPIGWSCQEAPLSWWHSSDSTVIKQLDAAGDPKGNSSIIRYIIIRNGERSASNFFLWLMGIVISGFSLSFGAPFWYDMLGKLISFRNIGKSKA